MAADLGSAGFQIDACDAAVGGTLLTSSSAFGAGFGIGNFETVSVSAPGILRLEFYQPNFDGDDGIVLDLFEFRTSEAPEPGSFALMSAGALALGLLRRRMSR